MKSSDPIWYEAIRGNPLNVPTFTKELKGRIIAEAHLPAFRKGFRLQRLSIIGVGILCLFGLILFMNPDGISQSVKQQGEAAFSSLSQLGLLNDNKFMQAINQKYPDSRNEILYTQNIGKDKRYVFISKVYELKGFKSVSLEVGVFELETEGKRFEEFTYVMDNEKVWHWSGGISSVIDDDMVGTDKKLLTFQAGENQTPIFTGKIYDPQITQILVTDEHNVKHKAQIIHSEDGNDYWYIAILNSKDNLFRVKGLNVKGKVLTEVPYVFSNR